MVLGWRRVLCSSIPRDDDSSKEKRESSTPRLGLRLGFLSNPSTPRGQSQQPDTGAGLRCKTRSKSFESDSASPRSPSAFSIIKSSFRLSRVRCGICLHSIKTGQGTAIFTAECSHGFHFPCIATYATKHIPLSCPICGSVWKDPPMLNAATNPEPQPKMLPNKQSQRPGLKVYNDDEPLMSPKLVSRFTPIPEDDEEEFEFCVAKQSSFHQNVEVMLLPEAAVVSVGRNYETYVVVMKVRASPSPAKRSSRVPIDLVTVLDVGSGLGAERAQAMRRALRAVLSSLSSTDRLSVVAFGAVSKRLLPLRRMSANGKVSVKRIIDALVSTEGNLSVGDAIKKARKVLEDRRERNPTAAILLLSDSPMAPVQNKGVPIHSLTLDQACSSPSGLNVLNVSVLGLRVELGFVTGSGQAEIAGVYSVFNPPEVLSARSVRVGDLYAEEERQFFIELKVPLGGLARSHHVLSVRLGHVDSSSQEFLHGKEQGLLVPRPQTARSDPSSSIERLRLLFFSTRAVAESRKLVENGDIGGASRLLNSTRALIMRSKSARAEGFVAGLEAELAELRRRVRVEGEGVRADVASVGGEEKGEPLTPTSAWRAAERLAKVAIMRKSMNRVSDLHGFEDARF